MLFNKMKEYLAVLQKELDTQQHSIKTLKQNVQDLYNIMYKDSDSIINRLNIAQARMDILSRDTREASNDLEKNKEELSHVVGIVNKNEQTLERIALSMEKESEKRSKFYYALLVPIIIALLPTITNFFAITETETDIDQIIKKLEKIENRQFNFNNE